MYYWGVTAHQTRQTEHLQAFGVNMQCHEKCYIKINLHKVHDPITKQVCVFDVLFTIVPKPCYYK